MNLIKRLHAAQLRGNTHPTEMHLLDDAAKRIAELEAACYNEMCRAIAAEAKVKELEQKIIKLADFWDSIQFGSDWWTTMQCCSKALRELVPVKEEEGK